MVLDERPVVKGGVGILIIGVGNRYRRDDGVGLIVAWELKTKGLPSIIILEETGGGAALMERWKGADTVILVDAVSSGATPGTVHRFDVHTRPIPTKFFRCSTHAFSIAEVIELARVLNQLPPRLIVYGIEGRDFGAGVGLSREVEKAAQDVVKDVLQELHVMRWGRQ